MAVIQKKIKLVGSKGSKEVLALFDSGATYSCITPDLAKQLEKPVQIPGGMTFRTAKRGERLNAQRRISVKFYHSKGR
ncbi:MAG: retropepsin-like aspartic protease [candidate division WOR-3 bacterium]